MSDNPWTIQRVVQCVSPGLCRLGTLRLRASYLLSSYDYNEPFWLFLFKMMPYGYWDYLVPSLLFAVLTFWHGRPRRTSKWQAGFWLVFVLCFNLAGYMTYLSLNHTPLIRCAACGKKRGLRQDACPHCHTPLPEPEHTRPHLVMAP